MNILVIGNGFDLEHNLPTKYTDFLKFVEKFDFAYTWSKHMPKELCKIEDEYLKLIFERPEYENRVNALHIFTSNNVWLDHFKAAYTKHLAKKENWIDFEREISDVIQSLDKLCQYFNGLHTGEDENKKLESYFREKLKYIGDFFSAESIIQKIPELLYDLNRLIGALEIYMWDYIGSEKVQYYNPDIAEICPGSVLSFNYSDTYRLIYAYNQKNVDCCYIHGKAENNFDFFEGEAASTKEKVDYWIQKNADSNNMVLGIDEYLPEERRNKEVDFIAFKKYYQRIYKKNGNEYKKWLERIEQNIAAGRKEENILYIFGHSLDETDGDILREFITHKHIKTIIYYRDKKQLGQQIVNLVKILTTDKMIEMVYGNHPSIIFQEQKKRMLIEGSPFEIASDTMQLGDIYRWSNLEAETLLNKITLKIKQNELNYFNSQKAVITLFNVLQKIGLANVYEKKLSNIAFALMVNDGLYEPEQYDQEEWAYQDYDNSFGCDSRTKKFIERINAYNRKNFVAGKGIAKSIDKKLIEYQKIVEDNEKMDKEKYISVINSIFDMFQDRLNDTESLWNMLLKISRGPGEKVAKFVLQERLKTSKNKLEITRYKHLLDEIQMNEYFDMQANDMQYLDENE